MLGLPSRRVLLASLGFLGMTACTSGPTTSSALPANPTVIAAFVSDRGVGVVDTTL